MEDINFQEHQVAFLVSGKDRVDSCYVCVFLSISDVLEQDISHIFATDAFFEEYC
jgi:hypothetical protein